ncbi:MAG: sigma-70 family RNA polymerase sigma factor [Gemmatimonadaceae bacterium]|nr:sigma-70 family RNA polymerase sigma factor [Gemmatimonadaceae bacterium]
MPIPPALSESVLTAIYRDTIGPLYGYVSRKCGGQRQLAEDVTQEAWLRAVREWTRTGLPDRPLAWLTTVARNLLLNQLRQREHLSLDDMPPSAVLAAFDHDVAADSADVAAIVQHALSRLPPDDAQLLDAFHFERCRVARLAEQLGTSERAVEGRLRRARERLRREIEIMMATPNGDFA